MLVSSNEFGVSWNDQYYTVRYITVDDIFPEVNTLVLSGPKNYDEEELYKEVKKMFPNAIILDIKECTL